MRLEIVYGTNDNDVYFVYVYSESFNYFYDFAPFEVENMCHLTSLLKVQIRNVTLSRINFPLSTGHIEITKDIPIGGYIDVK